MKPSLFADSARGGLFHLPSHRRHEVQHAVAQTDLSVRTADLGRCPSAGETLNTLGQALHFPDWYGANFDALHDCLGDPDWLPDGGLLLLVDGLKPLHDHDPAAFGTLLEVFRSAADCARAAGVALWIAVDIPAPGVADIPTA